MTQLDKSAVIIDGLQKAIFEHRIIPGTKLSEDEVGRLYGVSRTIVRSALQTLNHAQLVTLEKNRGAFIASPTIDEAHEVFEARALVEPRIAAMATERMKADHLKHLHNHIEKEHDALASGDKGKALALSGEFHLKIAQIAGHEVFSNFVETLIKRSSLIIALYWKRADTTCESHSHHALMQAFEDKNAHDAEEIMRSHIVDLHSGLNLQKGQSEDVSLAKALGF